MSGPRNTRGRIGDAADALHRVFGFKAFRPNQETIVRTILDGRDVVAVMPTGGGKSLCYQLPSCVLDGVCVVVSPLISLMKDQVDAAKANGIRAEFYNSSLTAAERSGVLRELSSGRLDLLYVSPERFAMDGFVATLQRAKVCLVAVDEAHCISQWGHDFRPDYLKLSRIVEAFPHSPVAAFTATATPHVQRDIIERLALREPLVVRASFDRPNLFYQVTPKRSVNQQLVRFLKDRAGDAGIVYRTTRASVEETADRLNAEGFRALPYHAGLDAQTRKAHQEAFNRDEVEVVVATIAFGMGIDKSNIRFVVHADLPKDIESYYQETGRAGRDGEPAHCLLLFGRGDIVKIRYFIGDIADDTEREAAEQKLRQMVRYASTAACRRRAILGYFGEEYPKDDCGACDVCADELPRVDATREAQVLMSAVARTGEQFGAGHVVDVVTGANTERIRQRGHDRLKTYGAGADKPKEFWRAVVDELIAQECLRTEGDRYPVLQLTDKGREVLFGRREFAMAQHEKPKARAPAPAKSDEGWYDPGLFERLRELRKSLARKQNVPPYVVFSDRTLRELARSQPTGPAGMLNVTGIGATKLARYGEAFLAAIREHAGDARQS